MKGCVKSHPGVCAQVTNAPESSMIANWKEPAYSRLRMSFLLIFDPAMSPLVVPRNDAAVLVLFAVWASTSNLYVLNTD